MVLTENINDRRNHNDTRASLDISTDLLNDLQQRANALLAKLRAYQACLRDNAKFQDVEIRSFKRGVESEAKTLNAVSRKADLAAKTPLTDFEIEELEAKRLHALRSSNLPFYEAVWSVLCQSEGIVALGKRVYCESSSLSRRPDVLVNSNDNVFGESKKGKPGAVVDIVAKNGLEWIKVSTLTEKRLLFEMAKEGWEGYGGRSSSEDSDTGEIDELEQDKADRSSQLELMKLARVLCKASRESRIRFRHPHIRFVLPNIQESIYSDVDAVMEEIRSMGIEVVSSNGTNGPVSCDELATTLDLTTLNNDDGDDQDMTRLLPSPSMFSPRPTPTLNIDCTILLALISDISHVSAHELPPYPRNMSDHYHKAIARQVQAETSSPLLSRELYPLLAGRSLVCTSHAAQRMREIVQTMGTDTEKARADIMLAEQLYHDASSKTLREALQNVSRHDVPPTLQLPIQIITTTEAGSIDVDTDATLTTTPAPAPSGIGHWPSTTDTRVLEKVSRTMTLSAINRSVFLYGWRAGLVTVTSNRVVAASVVKCVNAVLDEEEREREREQEQERLLRTNGGHRGHETVSGQRDAVAVAAGDGDGDDDDVDRDFEGPKIYVCETARSLVGKEKPDRGGE